MVKIESATAVPEPEPVSAAATAANGGRPPHVGIITIGGCGRAVLEAQHLLARDGVAADVLRVRAFPFHPSIRPFVETHARVFVVEQNRDGQLRSLLATELEVPITRLESLRFYGGQPLSAPPVVAAILERLGVAPPGAAEPPELEVAGGS